MAPKIVGLRLCLPQTAQHEGWRVTSTSRGRAYVVSLGNGDRSWEPVEKLYRLLDEGLLVIREKR